MAKDPICGMDVSEDSVFVAELFGRRYYFCCSHCLDSYLRKTKFSQRVEIDDTAGLANKLCCRGQTTKEAKEPSTHACCGGSEQEVKPSNGAAFFCPMCPGVESSSQADCPICGMALIPNPLYAGEASREEGKPKEWREFVGAAVLSLPVFLLAMLHMVPSVARAEWYHAPWVVWTQAFLTTILLFSFGRSIFVKGWRSVLTKRFNMWTLISLGTGAAYFFSCWSLWKGSVHHEGSDVGVYFESAAVIVTFVLMGQLLESKAQAKTGTALKELMHLSPQKAWKLSASKEELVDAKLLQLGDQVRVKTGEQVPVDGIIIDGSGSIDESMLTGESLPVSKAEGDSVTGGTLNLQSSFVMKTTRVGSDTVLSQIILAVSEAQHSRAPIQSVADRVAAKFVPTVVAISLLTAVCWIFLAKDQAFQKALEHAVAVLVIACPCALGLATPLSVMAGVGRAARDGVLIRNAEALQRLDQVNTIVFDKTGTLTEGKARLVKVHDYSLRGENWLIQFAASVEKYSTHPLAFAMVKEAQSRDLNFLEVEKFQQHQAAGVEGMIEERSVRVGTLGFLRGSGVNVDGWIKEDGEDAATHVYMSVDSALAARFDFKDRLKSGVKDNLLVLKQMGLESYVLSGDRPSTVEAITKDLPLRKGLGEQTPASKRDFIQLLQQRDQRVVAMVGDGVNDAIALSVADVGIAVSDGSDVAKQSASVTLLRGDLSRVAIALKISKLTMRNIRQNLFFAFCYNALGIPLAAGLFLPLFGWELSPMFAGLAMSFSSLSVALNSLRIGAAKL